jgi:hypothetical protein
MIPIRRRDRRDQRAPRCGANIKRPKTTEGFTPLTSRMNVWTARNADRPLARRPDSSRLRLARRERVNALDYIAGRTQLHWASDGMTKLTRIHRQ